MSKVHISTDMTIENRHILLRAEYLHEMEQSELVLRGDEYSKFIKEYDHAMSTLQTSLKAMDKRMDIFHQRVIKFTAIVLDDANIKRATPDTPPVYFLNFVNTHKKLMNDITCAIDAVDKATSDFKKSHDH
ncbi:422_t:CDS:2 [Cetraspora pellucida]|uniref:422_t:CDS:1 n=1 Tax=Cetraspora pellucida TaxID=1433469 RepID=A0A9N9I1M2_9GLOM|nr:422_t:CDS:2 [Cetraspora pellucida]